MQKTTFRSTHFVWISGSNSFLLFFEALGAVVLVFAALETGLQIEGFFVMYWIKSPSDGGGKSHRRSRVQDVSQRLATVWRPSPAPPTKVAGIQVDAAFQ